MRNQLYEQTLNRQGVKWSYVQSVALDDINTQKGLAMQARLEEPILEDVVERYKERYLAGEEAPPLVLAKPGRGKYLPLDGNQRIEASKRAKRKGHAAYVVDSTDHMVLERICWSFNVWVNGQPLSYEDRLAHAITFCRKYGWAAKRAGEEFGVPMGAVGKEVRAQELRETCQRHHVTPPRKEVLIAAAPLAALGDDLFVQAAKACGETGASVTDAAKLTKDVRAARTIAAKQTAIQEFVSSDRMQARRAETKNGRVCAGRLLVRDRYNRLLRDLMTLLQDHPREALVPATKTDQATQREIAAAVHERLTLLYGFGALPDRAGRREEA